MSEKASHASEASQLGQTKSRMEQIVRCCQWQAIEHQLTLSQCEISCMALSAVHFLCIDMEASTPAKPYFDMPMPMALKTNLSVRNRLARQNFQEADSRSTPTRCSKPSVHQKGLAAQVHPRHNHGSSRTTKRYNKLLLV